MRADCFRILARHSDDLAYRARLIVMAEEEDRKIEALQLESSASSAPTIPLQRWEVA